MKIGFTGTRKGLTEAQEKTLRTFLNTLLENHQGELIEFHHGDCIGADAQSHAIVKELCPDAKMVGHIPVNQSDRAFCKFDEGRAPLTYLARNRRIIAESDIMIGCPPTNEPQERGGTWYTINKAIKDGKITNIIYPNGQYASF